MVGLIREQFDVVYARIVEQLRGTLTADEYRELIALEYVLTWGYDQPGDEERYKYLTNKKDYEYIYSNSSSSNLSNNITNTK